MKKNLLILIFIMLFVFSCMPGRELSVSVESIDLANLTLQKAELNSVLSVYNPYVVGLSIQKAEFAVDIEGNQLFQAETLNGVDVAANSSSNVDFQFDLIYMDIYNIVQALSNQDVIDYVIRGAVYIDCSSVPGVGQALQVVRLPFEYSGTVPNINLDVSIENVDIQFEGFSPETAITGLSSLLTNRNNAAESLSPALSVTYTLVVTNNTSAVISFKKVDYKVHIGGQEILAGESLNFNQISENSSSITITNSVNIAGALLTAVQASRSYQITGQIVVALPAPFGEKAIPIDFSGSF